jgi:vancomycin resistance protein YoaR
MPDIGKVTVFQPNRTTITSPNYKPKPNVSLAEITDVSTEGVENGFSLVYSSANNRFEMKVATTVLAALDGGLF